MQNEAETAHLFRAKSVHPERGPWWTHIKYAERTQPGHVYFAQADASGLIKIGWSSEVARRIRLLKSQSPVRLVVLGMCPGAYEHEQALHRHFKPSRKHGEWFGPAPALMAFIRALKDVPDPFNFSGHVVHEIVM